MSCKYRQPCRDIWVAKSVTRGSKSVIIDAIGYPLFSGFYDSIMESIINWHHLQTWASPRIRKCLSLKILISGTFIYCEWDSPQIKHCLSIKNIIFSFFLSLYFFLPCLHTTHHFAFSFYIHNNKIAKNECPKMHIFNRKTISNPWGIPILQYFQGVPGSPSCILKLRFFQNYSFFNKNICSTILHSLSKFTITNLTKNSMSGAL